MASEVEDKLPDGTRFNLLERAELIQAFQFGWKKVAFAIDEAHESQARYQFARLIAAMAERAKDRADGLSQTERAIPGPGDRWSDVI